MLRKALIYKEICVLLVVVVCSFTQIQAQSHRLEVLSTTGDHFVKGNYQLSQTLGETVTITQGNRYYFATQGFHQIDYRAVVIYEYQEENITIDVYPNPVLRNLNIDLPDKDYQDQYTYALYSLTFQEIAQGELSDKNNLLELGQLTAGQYMLHIANDNGLIKTSKIIKTH